MEQIEINDITIDIVRKNIKNMHLAVYPPAGRVRLAVPLHVNNDVIRLFAISKLGWIKRSQRKYQEQERISPREYKQRESHYFQGQRYLLRVTETEGRAKVVLKSKTYIEIHIRKDSPVEKIQEVMNSWYRAELKKIIPPVIEKWEKIIPVKVNRWHIRLMKTKWGSCKTEEGSILCNLELAKKPVQCLEYIIVHEMIHLLERTHNDRFFKLLEHYYPGWKKTKAELNRFPISHSEWNY